MLQQMQHGCDMADRYPANAFPIAVKLISDISPFRPPILIE